MLAQPVSSASGSRPDGLLAQEISPPDSCMPSTKSMAFVTTGHIVSANRPIAGDQHVVPDTGRDVGAEVAVAVGVLDDAVADLDRPGAVRPLHRAAPLERGARGLEQARPWSAPSRSRRGPRGRCGRRRTTESRPRTPVWRRSTERSGGTAPASGRRAHPERQETATGTTGFVKYIATLLPISGFSADSAVRVSHGRLIMSHTSNL